MQVLDHEQHGPACREPLEEPQDRLEQARLEPLALAGRLGGATRAEALEVRWPDGRKTILRDVPADRVLVVPAPPG